MKRAVGPAGGELVMQAEFTLPRKAAFATLTRLADGCTRLTLRHAGLETETARAVREAGRSLCFDPFTTISREN